MQDIRDMVDLVLTEQQRIDVLDAFRVLELLDATRHYDLLNILLMNDSLSTNEIALRTLNVVQDVILLELQAYGLDISKDSSADIPNTVRILEALISLPVYDDKESIKAIIDNEETDEIETLHQLCGLVVDIPAGKFYELVVEYPESLLTKLSATYENSAAVEVETIKLEEKRKLRKRVLQAVANVGLSMDGVIPIDELSHAYSFILSRGLGYNLNQAIKSIYNDLPEDIDDGQFTIEVVILAAGSTVPDVSTAVNTLLEHLIGEEALYRLSAKLSAYTKGLLNE